MASLALMVALIFLVVILSGPLALIFSRLGLPFMTIFFGFASIVMGTYWCCVAPFPISILGLITAICGGVAIAKI